MALPRSNSSSRRLAVLGLLGVVLLPGLALGAEDAKGSPLAANADEQALLERAKGYWDARVERSRDVFDYYVPADKGGPDSVFESGGVVWRAFEIQGVAVDGEKGLVTVKTHTSLSTQLPVALPESVMSPVIQEAWVKVDGTWYKKEVKPGLSRHRKRREQQEQQEQQTAAEEPEAKAPAGASEQAEPPAKASERDSD